MHYLLEQAKRPQIHGRAKTLMKFHLVDKIESIEPGRRIVTVKAVSLAEEYLADHFPTFPVLPGVLMLEALVQSAAWLVRLQQGFAKSVIVVAAARNVRYAGLVRPGSLLRCEAEAKSIDETCAKFKASALVCDAPGAPARKAVTATLELRCFNLAEKHAYLAAADAAIVAGLRQRFELIAPRAAGGAEPERRE